MVLLGLVAVSACGGKTTVAEGGNTSGSPNTGNSPGSTPHSNASPSSTSTSTYVKDEGFSHACATDADCVLAAFGDTCGICNFSNGSVAKSSEAAWQQAHNAARGNCPDNREVGKCAARYGISRCNEAKQCTYVACSDRPTDEHHCARDGGG